MGHALAAVALLWAFSGAIASYLRDQFYQEHFLYLWVFFGLALGKSLRGPWRRRFATRDRRDRLGLAFVAAAWLGLAGSEIVGSGSGLRTAFVAFVTGVGVLAVPAWTIQRCLMHGLLMQLCFGFPYSFYFPLTAQLQWGVASCIALPARLGWVDYSVDGAVVTWPHYQLTITPDCSGLGQLLTFLGIAALGVLSARPDRRRTIRLVLVATGLAWASNLARVGLFVVLVGQGWTAAVEDATWHALLGFLVFLPFVTILVALILRSHVPIPRAADAPVPAGRWAVAWLVVPCVLVAGLLGRGASAGFPAPAYFASLVHPPQHALELRGPSEASDKLAYATPWLLNARFRGADGQAFDLFHYATRSNSHLCVHKVAACLQRDGVQLHYEPPVVVDGRSWWRLALDAPEAAASSHVYFAFEIAGQRRDDSFATQLHVAWERLTGGSWEVRCSRVQFAGPLPAAPGEHETAVLTWLGRLTAGPP